MDKRLILLRGVIHPWHHDQFGHMNVRHYAPFFDDSIYLMWSLVGVPYPRMIADHGVHTVSAEAKTTFIKELTAGDLVTVDGVVTHIGNKSVCFHLRMIHADTGELHATYDLIEVFFSPETRKATPMPDTFRQRLAAHLVDRDDGD